jgi:hypothetical protein
MVDPTNTSTPMPVELTARGGALLELVGDAPKTTPQPISRTTQPDYSALWRSLRQQHGLSDTLAPSEAQAVAEVLLRAHTPRGVIRMRSRDQRCGSPLVQIAGPTTISGSSSRTRSCRSTSSARAQ